MDYKYIEQLLERYWECQTTLEEEAILRKFFAQDDLPASLLPYRDIFTAEAEMAEEHLSDNFEQQLMQRIGARQEQATPCRTITLGQRLQPFYRAAAIVAIVLTIGMAAQQGFDANEQEDTQSQLTEVSATGDTLQLFTDMPEASPKAEAVLTPSASDTIIIQ